jgi:hypothetical protein
MKDTKEMIAKQKSEQNSWVLMQGSEICTAGSDNYTLTVSNSGTDILKDNS